MTKHKFNKQDEVRLKVDKSEKPWKVESVQPVPGGFAYELEGKFGFYYESELVKIQKK